MSLRKALTGLVIKATLGLILLGLILFCFSGTVNYFEAWLLLLTISVVLLFFIVWLYFCHPNQIINRSRPFEQNRKQQIIVSIIGLVFVISIIVAGIDKRLGWSKQTINTRLPIAYGLLIISISIYINVFKINPYLTNTIETSHNQEIITKGMYKNVRHPMYLATLLSYASILLILGSKYTFILYVLFVLLVMERIEFEEIELESKIANYSLYKKNVKYKLVPYIY